MADNDDKNLETQETTEVDESQTQDESVVTESESTETSEESSEGDQSTDWWKPEQKRFTQFEGDTLKDYFDNLESAYANSYNEYKKVKDQLEELRAEKLSAVANTDSGKANEGEGKQKPPSTTDMWVEQEMKRRHVEQYNKFAESHPEVNEDDDLFTKLDEETGRYMNYVLSTEKRVPDLAESLEFAWMRVGPKDRGSKEEQVVSAVKNAGSASKSKSVTKDSAKSAFTDKQIEAAKKINPSWREKSRTEIEELLSKYVK